MERKSGPRRVSWFLKGHDTVHGISLVRRKFDLRKPSQLKYQFEQLQILARKKIIRASTELEPLAFCISAAMLYLLSYEFPYVGSRPIGWILIHQNWSTTIDLSSRPWGINPTNSVIIPQSLVLRSVVLGWINTSKLVYLSSWSLPVTVMRLEIHWNCGNTDEIEMWSSEAMSLNPVEALKYIFFWLKFAIAMITSHFHLYFRSSNQLHRSNLLIINKDSLIGVFCRWFT